MNILASIASPLPIRSTPAPPGANPRLPGILSIKVLIVLLLSVASVTRATVIDFVFSGTITGFSAYRQQQVFPFAQIPLPNLANPGDPFTGTAFFDTQDNTNADFIINVDGQSWGFSQRGAFFTSFMTSTELFIAPLNPDLPYGMIDAGSNSYLDVSLISLGGSFLLTGDTLEGDQTRVDGSITSFRTVPDSGTTVELLGIGLIGLMFVRGRWRFSQR